MALAIAVTDTDVSQKLIRVYGTLTFSGSYTTGGEAISFSGLVPGLANIVPSYMTAWGIGGYTYSYVKSSKKLLVQQGAATGSNPQAQISQAAYPAGVTSDVVNFEAIFPKV